MGGRGSSSKMGGGGGGNTANLNSMSTTDLQSMATRLQRQEEAYTPVLSRLASDLNYQRQVLGNFGPHEYYEKRKEWQQVQSRRREVQAEIMRRKSQEKASSPQQTQVNGYGERTKREITSSTYKRAQARLNRDFDRWFGRGVSKK